MDMNKMELALAAYEDTARAHRRALHKIPELGFNEHKTHQYLMEQLTQLAPDELRVFAGTGIRAVFKGKTGEKAIAFRSDIDALPVKEETGRAFASEHEGFMHACGHDGHMAALLTFAKWISDHRGSICEDVVLIFQPAEETTGGAKPMVEEGVLENPHVEAIYGMHVMPDVPKGKIATCVGPLMAQTCELDIIIHGTSAHGATPHLGCDAVAAMGHLIALLQTSVARRVDPSQQALVTIGRVQAGTQRNIIANKAVLEGIIRTYSNEVYERLESCIRDDLRAVEAAFDVKTEMIKRVFYPCVNNDEKLTKHVMELLGDRYTPAKPKMTAEDFSFYQLSVPGVFVFCGVMDEKHTSPLHASTFDFEEDALMPGIALFASLLTYAD